MDISPHDATNMQNGTLCDEQQKVDIKVRCDVNMCSTLKICLVIGSVQATQFNFVVQISYFNQIAIYHQTRPPLLDFARHYHT